jgi:hypothetical protein
VSALYLYAVLGAAPAGPLGAGLAGEPLRLVDCAGLLAAAGEMAAPPSLAPDTLRGHDAVVRRLADAADAVLPARFGALAADDAELCDRLTRAGEGLREALARVAGREQMILRVYAGPGSGAGPVRPTASGAQKGEADGSPFLRHVGGSPTGPAPAPGPAGPGTSYLAERARAQRSAADVHELMPIRPVLDRFVAAERVERHHTPPLVVSVYHLLARGRAAAYTAAVEEAARELPGLRVAVSGPWAPYAFAPESLG